MPSSSPNPQTPLLLNVLWPIKTTLSLNAKHSWSLYFMTKCIYFSLNFPCSSIKRASAHPTQLVESPVVLSMVDLFQGSVSSFSTSSLFPFSLPPLASEELWNILCII